MYLDQAHAAMSAFPGDCPQMLPSWQQRAAIKCDFEMFPNHRTAPEPGLALAGPAFKAV